MNKMFYNKIRLSDIALYILKETQIGGICNLILLSPYPDQALYCWLSDLIILISISLKLKIDHYKNGKRASPFKKFSRVRVTHWNVRKLHCYSKYISYLVFFFFVTKKFNSVVYFMRSYSFTRVCTLRGESENGLNVYK